MHSVMGKDLNFIFTEYILEKEIKILSVINFWISYNG